ncbi:MAG: hypothetical protein KF699_06095 [Phycisphaeraceae bacterium]|nr:hypothetical protein [Phycisphaeraceae bacterium]MBX3407823.1 hypothetical protein [Phycisphaeraceae bacterium]
MTNLNPTAPQGPADKPEAAPDGVVGGTFRLEAMSASGDAPPLDPSVAPARKGLRSTQTIALALLVVAAGGVVYGMRQAGIGPMGALATTKMPDYDVTKAPGSKTADHKRVLAQLEATTTGAQVPADQVQKNPFRLADLLSTDGGPVDDGASEAAERARAERVRRDAEARAKRVAGELASLKVNAIMGGSTPVARLGGDLYRVGDTVGEFTVTAIRAREVDLESDGQTYTLSLDQSDPRKSVRKK